MNYKLPTIFKSVTLIIALVLFGLSQAKGQSDYMTPYEPDENTVILMDFDDQADSLMVQHGQDVDAPDSAIVYQGKSNGVMVPDSSWNSNFGSSLFLNNTEEDKNTNTYNFIAIPYFESGFYPENHQDAIPDTGSAAQYTDLLLAEDITIEFWARVEDFSADIFQMVNKPGSESSTGPRSDYNQRNYAATLYKNGEFSGEWHPGGNPVVQTDSAKGHFQKGNWYHFKFVKDFDKRVALTMIHNTDGDLVASNAQTFSDDVAVSDTSKRNDIFIGWEVFWNIHYNNYAPTNPGSDSLGNESSLGGAGKHAFYGNLDELRISNIARQYQDVNIPYLANGTNLDPQSVEKSEYEVSVDAGVYGSNTLANVNLVYDAGNGWQEVQLTEDATGGTFTGAIPQQDAGTTVNYYYEVKDSQGNTKTLPANATGEGNYYSFTVFVPSQEVLSLSFEEQQSEVPVDSSNVAQYQTVVVNGDTTYSTQEFVDGSSSFEFTGSNQVAIEESPFSAADVITADLWFNATTMPDSATRLIAKEGVETWDNVNYEIRFGANGSLVGNAAGISALQLDSTITTGEWYRVVYMISESAASIQLRNANDEVIDSKVMAISNAPELAQGPLVIGHAGDSEQPYFQGYMDRVRVANYNDVEGPFKIANMTDYYRVSEDMGEYPIDVEVAHAGKGNVDGQLHYRGITAGVEGWKFNNLDHNDDGTLTTNITSQPVGSVIPYYVEANTGPFSDRYPDATGEDTTLAFGIPQEYTQTLDLNFENTDDNGIPQDQSMYSENQMVEFHGKNDPAVTSDDAAEGSNSLAFSRQDSNYVTIDSPFLTSDEFTLDFWLKVEEFGDPADFDGLRFFARPGDSKTTGNWWQPNYQILFKKHENDGTLSDSVGIQFSSHRDKQGLNGGNLRPRPLIVENEWYRLTYEYARDSVYVKVSDSEGNLVAVRGYTQSDNGASITRAPFYLGHVNNQFLSGKIDDIDVYNYPVTLKPPKYENVQAPLSGIEGEGPYTISADLMRDVTGATLHYSTDGGESWSSVEMSSSEGSSKYSAEIPDMSSGDQVHYYMEAQNSYGTKSYSPANAAADSNYYAMSIAAANDKVLHLSFEEGEEGGAPVDSSSYNHEVMMKGLVETPSYTEDTHSDSIGGSYAMEFAEGDSSYIQIESPLLSGEEFTVDLWFKAYDKFDVYGGNPRIISKQGASPWWQMNYQILFNNLDNRGILGSSYVIDDGGEGIYLDDHMDPQGDGVGQVEPNKWYRAVYSMTADSTHFSLRDSSNTVVKDTTIASVGTPVVTEGPLTIGHAGNDGNPYFLGVVDEVKLYNYGKEVAYNDTTSVAIDDPMAEVPREVELKQNYPNPFNPSTRIRFALPDKQKVTLKVYDMLAREVATLVQGTKDAGRYNVNFNASHLSSGVYFYRLTTEETTKVRKMMLIK